AAQPALCGADRRRALPRRDHRRNPRLARATVNAHAEMPPARANARQLRIVASTQTGDPQATSARRRPALAVWRLEHARACELPCELTRQVIAHYSDPGQLVIAAGNARAVLAQARRL